MIIKNKAFKILAGFLLVITLFSFVNACGFQLIVESPNEGAIYIIGEDVVLSAKIISVSNVQVKVIAKVMFPDGNVQTFPLYENSGVYEEIFSPSLEGDYKVAFYAEDIFGNSAHETKNFVVKEEIIPPSNNLNLNIIFPEQGTEYDLLDEIVFSAEIIVFANVQKEVWVVLEKEGGFELSFNLETLDEIIYSKTLNDLDEGEYTATFYVKDDLGNEDSEQTYFSIKDEFDDDPGIIIEDEDEYYVCTLWSQWSGCDNGYQGRTCLEEEIVNKYFKGASLTSLLGFKEFRSCVIGYQISSTSETNEDNFSFDLFYWIALSLALFILIALILVVVVMRRK